MKLSNKPRHWIVLILALFSTIVAVISFANFSGQPDPKWIKVLSLVMPTLVVLAVVYNISLDKKDPKS